MPDKNKVNKKSYQNGNSAALQVSECERVEFQDFLFAGHKSRKVLHYRRDAEKHHVYGTAAHRDF